MYQDLTVNASLMAEHSIIKGLTGGYISERTSSDDIPEKKDLENEVSPERMLYILDADSSQSRAIETSIKGHSFVLKGPPGTGKSQTICNIIAEFLEAGKTVLFVSEKMAALEVVFNRLKEAHLTDFCLELHSHKAKKKEVVKELMRCLEFRPVLNKHISHAEFEKLYSLRNKLNSYVQELHLQREPIEKSMYEIFAYLFKLENIPLVTITFSDDSSYSPSSLLYMEDLVSKLRNNYLVVEEGNKFPWRGFHLQRLTPALRSDLNNLLIKIRNGIEELNGRFIDYATRVGLEEPQTFDGCQWVINIAKLLVSNPMPIRFWLEQDNSALIDKAEKFFNLRNNYESAKNAVLSEFSPDFLTISDNLHGPFKAAWDKAKSLLSIDDPAGEKLLCISKDISIFLDKTKRLIDACRRDVREVRESLGVEIEDEFNLERAKQLAELGSLVFSEHRPEKHWFDPVSLNKVGGVCTKLRPIIERHNKLAIEVDKSYDKGIYALDLTGMIYRFENKYKGIVRYFLPSFYSDKKLIRKTSKSGAIPQSIIEDLKIAREGNSLSADLNKLSDEFKQVLGHYFEGFDTDFNAIDSARELASRIIHLVGELPLPEKIVNIACLEGIPHPNLQTVANRLQTGILEWEAEAVKFSDSLSLNRLSLTNLPAIQSPVSGIETFVDNLHMALDDFDKVLEKIIAVKSDGRIFSCLQVLEKFNQCDKLKSFEKQIDGESRALKNEFGGMFIGVETDWQKIINGLVWSKEFFSLTKDSILPDEFINNISKGEKTKLEEMSDLEQSFHDLKGLIEKLSDYFDNTANYFSKINFFSMSVAEMKDKTIELINRIDDLQLWFEYASCLLEAKKVKLDSFVEGIHSNPPQKDILMDVFHKAFYISWVDKICAEVNIIGEFRGTNHYGLIQEFRRLDKKLNQLSSSIIIEKLNELKPRLINIQGGEVAKVRNEAAKKSRHWPVRKLFSEIQNLLPKLKPCLLMSPLSVSHFLDQAKYKFDLVIFDEASQICSEDAVGAIARGRQLVVAGDNRQLPPTKFFQGDIADDEEYSEETPETFGIYQSILDDCERIGLTPQPLMLEWHYRSKHESLIAYSNSRFYENRLITFPCAKEKVDELGVKFVYVPDGIFDRGGKRSNLKEAEIVVELVFDHFSKYGSTKTLGVATLNLPQKDLILDVLEQKRKERPDLDKFFQDDRLSGFFVKNLEAVQGDERDVIILSLGYGKDSQGRFTMNFGPINKEGGERRLNVIVTRAKEKTVLVTSIKASDFNLNDLNSVGVRHLYHYLDYAERGRDALSLDNVSGGDAESPFEDEVKNVVKALGYEVVSQVGCSSFRIDLGVIDPARPGCFILGVECDGRAYHSAFTARERDRIRQDVLTSLGWKIHRIWSPDWFYRKENEIDNLRVVLEEARKGGFCVSSPVETHRIEISYTKNKTEDLKDSTEGIIAYKYFKCYRPFSSYEFNLADSGVRRGNVLIEIVEQEGPIHVDLAKRRLISAWGIGRIGSVVEETLERTIRNCIKGTGICKKGNFLWGQGDFKITSVRVPVNNNTETIRDPEYICEEEIQLALILIIKKAIGIEKEPLFTEVARLFGWGRSGERVENAISKAFKNLIKRGDILLNENKVSLNEGDGGRPSKGHPVAL
jgi:superfamily I DNA and/or RNA helicase/very-short-patch-repair endonuclease